MIDDAGIFANSSKSPPLTSRQGHWLALILLLLAAFLRFTYLVSLPHGYSEDEIINIRLVDNVRQGDIFVFFPGEDGGREGGYHVFAALATALVGDGPIGFRILSSWLSVLSVAILFTLGNHLFNPLVGIMAAALMTVNMSSILLARTASSDVTVAFLVSATMLALARSLPVYRRTRVGTSNVLSFSALGTLLGLGLYLHPSSLFIVAGALAYIAHLVFIRNQMFRQRRSYTGFAMLLMLIISIPYLIATVNLPQYSGINRILVSYDADWSHSIIDGLQGIMLVGDLNPLHNLPGRPLLDIISAAAILRGIVACVQRRYRPRFMLLLIMFLLTLPAALIVPESPNFARMAVILPQLGLFFGMGVYAFLRLAVFSDRFFRWLAVSGIVALLALNLIWTWQDLVADWRENEQVMQVVNGELGQIAHYLDYVGDAAPVVFCNPDWQNMQPSPTLNDAEKVLLMMNRDSLHYHEANCANTLLLTNGGELQRLIFFDSEAYAAANPHLQAWLALGKSVATDLPKNAVIELEIAELLAEKTGTLTTTAPVSYAREVAVPEPISPAIRFGGNLTLLGYEPEVPRSFVPGETVDIITYWRVDGELPPDLTLFTQILADPVTPIVTRHYIGVNPTRKRERDIFIQATQLQLPAITLPGEYAISVGLYRERLDQRLPVLKDGQAHGDRLFLYTIDVLPAEASETSG